MASTTSESHASRSARRLWVNSIFGASACRIFSELNQQTRETIHLTVRHGLSAVYVEKLDSPEQLRIHSRIGAAVPLYCTAVGKVMLAYMPDEERERILPQLGLKRLTPNTMGSLQELEAEL